MKRLLFTLLFISFVSPLALSARDAGKPGWRKTDDHWTRKNSISFTASTFGVTSYRALALPALNLEYDRIVYSNLSVSGIVVYASCVERSGVFDSWYANREVFGFVGAKVNYNLPVVRNWLYFRIGMGAGVGIHNMLRPLRDDCLFRGCLLDEAPPNRVKPHFIVDMYWIFRVTKWMELRFSPLLMSPSQMIVGGRFSEWYNRRTYLYYNGIFGVLGVGVRF